MANGFDAEAGPGGITPPTVSESARAKTTLIILAAALFVIALLVWIDHTFNRVDRPPGNDRFGLAFISAPDHLADEARYGGALATGARWDRWPLYWHWIDEGGYAGAHPGGRHDYDTLVTEEIKHGLTPLVILMGTPARQAKAGAAAVPAQAQVGPVPPLKQNTLPVSTATLPPLSLFEPIFADGTDEPGPDKKINPANAWADFVFKTVERYRPGGLLSRPRGWPRGTGVRYWEIWNEPDFASFWRGSVEEYYRLLEVAYKSIKTADPAATVVLGGLAFYEQPDWLPRLLRQANGDPQRVYFDVFSLHHYWSVYNSEARIVQSRAALDAHGLAQIPIWMTESGVSVWDDYPATAHGVRPDEPWRATRAEQADYVIQNAALAFYHGVEHYFHFMLHDDCGDGPSSAYGLRQNFTPHVCNPAQGKLRPAYAAYQLAAKQLHDISPLWREKKYAQDQVAFYRAGDRSRLLIVWATRGLTVTTTLSATGQTARLYWIDSQAALSETAGFSRSLTLTPTHGLYTLALPPATNQNAFDPDDTGYHIGGRPYLLVEPDTLPPRSTIKTLPPASPPRFVVAWAGQDLGSGVAGYDVWVSEDGQPLRLWLANTTATEAKYTGRTHHTYSFAVRARDRAGNEEPLPPQPQATTQVSDGPAVSGVVLDPAGQPAPHAIVTITGANVQESLPTDSNGAWSPVTLPPGEYTFQASAPAFSAWPAPRRLSLDAPSTITLTLAPLQNEVVSGDFEGDQVWTVWEWQGQVNLSDDAFDGQAAVRLGDGAGEPVPCPSNGQAGQLWAVRQPVTLSSDPAPILSFLYKISTDQTTLAGAWLEVALVVEDQTRYLIPPGELGQASAWRPAALDLSAWSGQRVGLEFRVVRCSEQAFSVTLDRVSIGHITQ